MEMSVSARLTLQIRSITGYLHYLKMDMRQPSVGPASPALWFISQNCSAMRLSPKLYKIEIERSTPPEFNINAEIVESEKKN